MTPPQQRTMEMYQAWVDGTPLHNGIDNECCPDFSCCNPEWFVQDRQQRIDWFVELKELYGIVT